MKKDSTRQPENEANDGYGLPADRFERLRRIIEIEQRNGVSDSETVRGVLQLVADYEHDYHANLKADIETILANDYPPRPTDEHVLDNLRKTKAGEKIKKAIPHRPVPGLSEQEAANKSACHDNEHRRGLPRGPTLCTDVENYFIALIASIKEGVFRAQGWDNFLDPDRPDPRIKNAQTQRPFSVREIATAVGEHAKMMDTDGNHPDFREGVWFSAFERIKAGCDMQEIFPMQLPTLPHIFVAIPLDCPDDDRDREIQRIVNTWRQHRQRAWEEIKVRTGEDLSYTTRDTRSAVTGRLRGLAERISDARKQRHEHGNRKTSNPEYSFQLSAIQTACAEVLQKEITTELADQFLGVMRDALAVATRARDQQRQQEEADARSEQSHTD